MGFPRRCVMVRQSVGLILLPLPARVQATSHLTASLHDRIHLLTIKLEIQTVPEWDCVAATQV